MPGSTNLSNRDQLAAILLYYFRAGQDSKGVLGRDTEYLEVPSPSLDDLEQLTRTTSMRMWKSVEAIASVLVEQILASEPRNPLDLAREVVQTVQKGKTVLEAFTSSPSVRRIVNPGAKR